MRDERGAVQDPSKWRGHLVSPLRKLPMQGPQLATLVDNINSAEAMLIHFTYTSTYLTVGTDKCSPIGIGDREQHLPLQVLFIVPRYTTPEMQERLEQEGPG